MSVGFPMRFFINGYGFSGAFEDTGFRCIFLLCCCLLLYLYWTFRFLLHSCVPLHHPYEGNVTLHATMSIPKSKGKSPNLELPPPSPRH